MLGIEGIIVGASGTLAVVSLGPRLFFALCRVRDRTAMKPRVRDGESAMVEGGHDGQPRLDRDQGRGVHGLGNAVGAATTRPAPPSERGICFLPACDHADRFIDWLIYDEDGVGHTVVMSDRSLFAKYLMWCERFSVVPLPEKTLQTLLGKRKQQVVKDRPIKKDPKTGRALYHATGSPDRWTRYTIKPPRKDVLPGKVPVGDIVEARPMVSNAERAAQKAAGPSVRPADDEFIETPFRRAA